MAAHFRRFALDPHNRDEDLRVARRHLASARYWRIHGRTRAYVHYRCRGASGPNLAFAPITGSLTR